jgi:hypothetical protein
MNVNKTGEMIEKAIKRIEKLIDDEGGFDAAFNKIPIEIKGCLKVHKNGVGLNGKEKVTKGRFWIDNNAHRILLERKGFYIFAIYYMSFETPTILEYEYKSASAVNRLIKSGDNTKIRYDVIFPNSVPEML